MDFRTEHDLEIAGVASEFNPLVSSSFVPSRESQKSTAYRAVIMSVRASARCAAPFCNTTKCLCRKSRGRTRAAGTSAARALLFGATVALRKTIDFTRTDVISKQCP